MKKDSYVAKEVVLAVLAVTALLFATSVSKSEIKEAVAVFHAIPRDSPESATIIWLLDPTPKRANALAVLVKMSPFVVKTSPATVADFLK